MIDDKTVKLMEMTGFGITDCKNAITKSDGDLEKARERLLNRRFPVHAMVDYSPKQNTRKD